MSNELIESLVGKQCDISTGRFGESFRKVEVGSHSGGLADHLPKRR